METGLKNRVVIVSASSQGIGKATAFAAEGAHLALCARQSGPLDALALEAVDRYGIKRSRPLST